MKWRIAALVALTLLGVALEALGVVDWSVALDWARAHAGWRLPAVIILAQIVLYTFGQPGSMLVWVAALLYGAPAAALILTAGALGAYLFARRLSRLDISVAREHRFFNILDRRGDFFTLCALRVLPGMPRSVINYAAGTLALPLPRFIAPRRSGLRSRATSTAPR